MPISPLEYAEELLDRALRLATAAGTPPSDDSYEADLLRAAWSFNGAAIDTYFHKRVRAEILSKPVSKTARKKFELSIGDVDDLVDSFIKNRDKARPRVTLKNLVDQKLVMMTFQGSSNIEHAFGLMGVTEYWADISAETGEPVGTIKTRLDRQYARRNRISHEGDFKREQRPQTIKYESVDEATVLDEIDWTRTLLLAADRVTT